LRTKVFTYKNYIGIQSNVKAEGLLNNPLQQGQLGFVVDAKFVDIQPEALELLKQIKRSGDCIGDVDVFQSDKCVVFSWLGEPLQYLDSKTAEGSRDHNPSLLVANNEVITPEEFKKFIDSL
jgi:hypothetical protein